MSKLDWFTIGDQRVPVGNPDKNSYVTAGDQKELVEDGGDIDWVTIGELGVGPTEKGILLGPWEDLEQGDEPNTDWSVDNLPPWIDGSIYSTPYVHTGSRVIHGDKTVALEDDGGGWTVMDRSYSDQAVRGTISIYDNSETYDGDRSMTAISAEDSGSILWDMKVGNNGEEGDPLNLYVGVGETADDTDGNELLQENREAVDVADYGDPFSVEIREPANNFQIVLDGTVIYEHGSGVTGGNRLYVYADDISGYVDYQED